MNALCKLLFIIPIIPFLLVNACLIFFAVLYDFIMDNNDRMENWVRNTLSKVFFPYLKWLDNKFNRKVK